MSEHRVSLSHGLRRHEDPDTSADTRVRAVVNGLRRLDYAPRPDPGFRAELRAQLVAITPRIVAEGEPRTAPSDASGVSVPHLTVVPRAAGSADEQLAAPAGTTRRPGAHRAPGRRGRAGTTTTSPTSPTSLTDARAERTHRLRRPLAIAASVAATLVLLLGGATWLSQRALPGDTLYGLKRASENVRLDLTSGDADRGHAYLSLAQTRVGEARALLGRDSASAAGTGALAGGVSAQTQQLVDSALSSADSDVSHGWNLLLARATSTHSTSPLALMRAWAPDQLDRLAALQQAAPTASLKTRTGESWTRTNNALQLARTWQPTTASGCASCSSSPAPATATTPSRVAPSSSAVPATTHATANPAPAAPATRARSGAAAFPSSSHGTAGTDEPAAPRTADATDLPAGDVTSAVPDLPTDTGSEPVAVTSCGVSVSVGGLDAGVSTCPSGS